MQQQLQNYINYINNPYNVELLGLYLLWYYTLPDNVNDSELGDKLIPLKDIATVKRIISKRFILKTFNTCYLDYNDTNFAWKYEKLRNLLKNNLKDDVYTLLQTCKNIDEFIGVICHKLYSLVFVEQYFNYDLAYAANVVIRNLLNAKVICADVTPRTDLHQYLREYYKHKDITIEPAW